MNQGDILLIDDETQIRKLIEITLQTHGYNPVLAATSREGLKAAAVDPPDLIILDIGLPDENGHLTLTKLRQWYTQPVIVLSVHSSEEDIVRALDNGANDYLVKPFRTGELLARIRSALRNSAQEENNPVIRFKEFEINLSSRTVKRNDEFLKLTATQYALLVLFGKNEGKVLTHQYMLPRSLGPGYNDQLQYLRVFIAQLRKKIETDPNRPRHIITESGIGYRFIASEI